MNKWMLLLLALLILVAGGLMHWVFPGQMERSANIVLPHLAYEITAETQALHDKLFIADLHADTLLWKRDMLIRSDIGHVDLPRLQTGNVALQFMAAVTKSPAGQNYQENTSDSDNITWLAVSQFWPYRTWSSLFERAMYQLQKLVTYTENSKGTLRLITSSAEMQQLLVDRKAGNRVTGSIFVIEGGHPLEGDIDNLDRLQNAGLRVIGLTHFFDNELGGSPHGTSGAGLSEFGRQVVRRAGELQLIIDVAHASPQMVRDVLALSRRPVILSHGGIKGLCDEGRNLDDKLMRKLAGHGAILGVGYWDGAACDITPEGIVKSIRYAIDLMGENAVALGSDYDGSTSVLFDTSELAVLTSIMLEQGFTEREIRKVMGENTRRLLLSQLPAH